MASLHVETPGRGLIDITARVAELLGEHSGVCHLFIRHTSASLLITENAAPAVRRDMDRFFARIVPDGDPMFEHDDEGPDDMPAHVRAALTQTTLTVPVDRGRLLLGTWQGIFVYEHRARPHRREIVVTLS